MKILDNQIDPTYLRTIHDGLVTGSANKDNASSLPYGLVGVYEEALPPLSNAADREKFNEFFAVWALLKKEVSAAFTASLLAGWTEDQVIGYIAQYSKWFNSPVSGMYVLYHERLRTFVLQKISQDHLSRCNHALIQQSSLALQSKSGDEWERYALEHLSTHLLTAAMGSKDASELKALAYSTAHWNRQIEISKGFEWSKRMLNDMMLWASKYDDDEVIECALNKVDLYYMEQNDAPRIVELVAQNDIETALQRIESFGGNDKEGLQRKFILYMLCLMELTLLDSKEKPFRKEAIEKLLRHLDENLKIAHSILNWNDFFPVSFMKGIINYLLLNNIEFESILKLSKLKIDINSLFKYSDDKIIKSDEYKYRNQVVLNFLEHIDSDEKIVNEKDDIINIEEEARTCFDLALNHLSKDEINKANLMAKQAIYYSYKIPSDDMWGSYGNHLLGSFALETARLGFHKLGIKILERMEKGEIWTDEASSDISNELLEKGDLTNLELLYSLTRKDELSNSANYVLKCLIDFHFSKESLHLIKKTLFLHLNYDKRLIDGFKQISFFHEVIQLNPTLKTFELLFELEVNKKGPEGRLFDLIIRDYPSEYSLGNFEKCIVSIVNFIKEDYLKASLVEQHASEIIKSSGGLKFVLQNGWFREDGFIESHFEQIFFEIYKETGLDDAINLISQIEKKGTCKHDAAIGILRAYLESQVVQNDIHLVRCEDVVQKLITVSNDEISEDRLFYRMLSVLIKYSKLDEVFGLVNFIKNNKIRCDVLIGLFEAVNKQSNVFKTEDIMLDILECAKGITEESSRHDTFKDFTKILAKVGKIDEALTLARGISGDWQKSSALEDISTELFEQGKTEEAASAMQEALTCARGIRDDGEKSRAMDNIVWNLIKQENIDEALTLARGISYDEKKIKALGDISTKLFEQGKTEEAASALHEALTLARVIRDDGEKSRAMNNIVWNLIKQENIDEAYVCAQGMLDNKYKSSSMLSISIELAKQEKIEDSNYVIKKAQEFALGISNETDRVRMLKEVSREHIKRGKIGEALESLNGINVYKERYDAINEALLVVIEIAIINGDTNIKSYLEQFGKLKSLDVKKMYLRNWAENIQIKAVNMAIVKKIILLASEEFRVIENILQYFIINQLFFNNIDNKKINQFEQRFNIKWAIDLKNSIKEI